MSLPVLAIAPKQFTAIAGITLLLIAVFGTFGIAYVPSVIIVADDAAKTASNLMANQTLFGLGVFSDVFVILAEIVLSVMIFTLFRPISPTLALIAAVARLMMVGVMAVNLLIYITPLILLRGHEMQSDTQLTALMLFEVHGYGVYVWNLFFGLHLAALGWLIFKSDYFPRSLGLAILVGSFGYSLNGLLAVTFLETSLVQILANVLLAVASIAELVFGFWLLIKGAKTVASNGANNAPNKDVFE